jgi:hypothetical protein
MELNTSMLLLPKTPMVPRLFDRRVGFFAGSLCPYSDDQQKVDKKEFAVRWKFEPKPEDLKKYKMVNWLNQLNKSFIISIQQLPKQWHQPFNRWYQ